MSKNKFLQGYEIGKKEQFEKDRDAFISDLYMVYASFPDLLGLDTILDKWENREFDDEEI